MNRIVTSIAWMGFAAAAFPAEGAAVRQDLPQITDLRVPTFDGNRMRFQFTIPGSYAARMFVVRASADGPIDGGNWDSYRQYESYFWPMNRDDGDTGSIDRIVFLNGPLPPEETIWISLKFLYNDPIMGISVESDPSNPVVLSYDEIAPATIQDLAVVLADEGSIGLRWTAPGDDDNDPGRASAYEIRYSSEAPGEDPEGWWNAAAAARWAPEPAEQGSVQEGSVSWLGEATTYHFAIKAGDERPNWNGISNIVSATTLPGGSHPSGRTGCSGSGAGRERAGWLVAALALPGILRGRLALSGRAR